MYYNRIPRKSRGWDGNQTSELLLKYINTPELWDKTLIEFKDRNRKAASLRKMAKYFSTDEGEIIRKLHNLRCQMNQQMRRMKKCKQEGKVFCTTWQYFDVMKLTINPTVWKRLTDGLVVERVSPPFELNQTIEVKSESEDDDDDPDENDDGDGGSSETPILDNTNDILEPEQAPTEDKPFNYPSETMHPILTEQRNLIRAEKKDRLQFRRNSRGASRSSRDGHQSDDYYQTFGNYVAAELRNLRSDVNRRKLVRIMQKAILDICEIDDQIDLNNSSVPSTTTTNGYINAYLDEFANNSD